MEARVAREDEWETIRNLRLRALLDAPDAFGSTYEEERGNGEPEWRSWVTGWSGAEQVTVLAMEGDAGLGLAVGARWEGTDAVAHLYAMWVDPAQRGRGIAAAMVGEIVRWAHRIGAGVLELRVTESNAAALHLYERSGFAPAGERSPLRESSDVMTVTMRRTLRSDDG
jgi:ribosomal protein S18 acetylase RimI-like enzyme